MTYFSILLVFLIPPILVLLIVVPRDLWAWVFRRAQRPDLLPYYAVLLHILLALIYTTPWDNYLVATSVWWYDPDLVVGLRLGWVPIEEYCFFVLQTLLTGLLTIGLLRRFPANKTILDPSIKSQNLNDFSGSSVKSIRVRRVAGLVVALVWLFSTILLLTGWAPAAYLTLILSWALIPFFLQVVFGFDLLLKRLLPYSLSILLPTIYLWVLDAVALRGGTWVIDPAQTLGWKLGVIPVEELLFFLMTNLIIAGGVTLMIAEESPQRLKKWLGRLYPGSKAAAPGGKVQPPEPDGETGLLALRAMLRERTPLAALQVFHANLGDVFRISLPVFHPIVLVGPEAARFVLVTARDDLSWRSKNDPVTEMLRQGVLVEDGEFHTALRRILQPSLQRRMLPSYLPVMRSSYREVAASWQAAGQVDMLVEMRKISQLALMQSLFGVDYRSNLQRLWKPILGAIKSISPGPWMFFPSLPRPGQRKAIRSIDRWLYEIIAERRQAPVPSEGSPADMLSDLISSGLPDDRIRDQLLTILIAGHDTVTALLAWTFYLLGSHPEFSDPPCPRSCRFIC